MNGYCASGNCCYDPYYWGETYDCECSATCRWDDWSYLMVGECTAIVCPDDTSKCYGGQRGGPPADPEDSAGPCADHQSSSAGIIIAILLLLLCGAGGVLGYAFNKKIWMFDPARKQQVAVMQQVAVVQQAGDEEDPAIVQPNATANQEAELQACKLPELRTKATEAGCDEDAIEDARDANDPKAALIALIVAATPAAPPAAVPAVLAGPTPAEQEAELQACKLPELRKKATEAGCDEDAIEDARDANDPKAALIALIMSRTKNSDGALRPRGNTDTTVAEFAAEEDAKARLEAEAAAKAEAEEKARLEAEAAAKAEAEEKARLEAEAAAKAEAEEKARLEAEAAAKAEAEEKARLEAEEKARLEAEAAAKAAAEATNKPFMTGKALRVLAAAAGCDPDAIEDARDHDSDPVTALRALVDSTCGWLTADQGLDLTAVRAELVVAAVKELRSRAVSAGVDQDDVEDARDADLPQEEITDLIIAKIRGSAASP
eukprot:COSAG02_NODE_1421_length_12690_cov_13.851561_3_plen_491_part_00